MKQVCLKTAHRRLRGNHPMLMSLQVYFICESFSWITKLVYAGQWSSRRENIWVKTDDSRRDLCLLDASLLFAKWFFRISCSWNWTNHRWHEIYPVCQRLTKELVIRLLSSRLAAKDLRSVRSRNSTKVVWKYFCSNMQPEKLLVLACFLSLATIVATQECGTVKFTSGLIYGGNYTKKDQYPW